MASFEEHIEGLTQIDIDSSSTPTTNELTEMLVEGLINTVNMIITLKPQEVPKFTKTTNATGSVVKKGQLPKIVLDMIEEDPKKVKN